MSYDKLIRDTVNGLYILDGDMKIAGSVENLAKGESIRSVRFVGTTAYIVTFRQTDPLFVIDTSDPHNPKVSGALKITGYSEYLHPAADGLLIGVGRDGTQDGANEACKVSLFDVSDPCNPKEISKISVVSMGEMGAVPYVYTPVGNNHKLFINLPDGEFAVMFDGSLYVRQYNFPVERKYFVRYKIEDSALEEVGRYVTAEGTEYIAGATYIGDTFYILARDRYSAQDVLYSYSLKTNEPTETVVLNGVQPKLNSPAS